MREEGGKLEREGGRTIRAAIQSNITDWTSLKVREKRWRGREGGGGGGNEAG